MWPRWPTATMRLPALASPLSNARDASGLLIAGVSSTSRQPLSAAACTPHVAAQAAIDAGRLDAGKPVDATALLAAGLTGKPRDGVRLLGKGVLTAKIAITVNHASRSAAEAVEKAGGTVTLVAPKQPAKGGDKAAGAPTG